MFEKRQQIPAKEKQNLTLIKPLDNILFTNFKKKIRAFLGDKILVEDCLKIKEEELATRAIDIFDAMPQNVFKRAWLNRILKEEDLDGEVEKFEEDEELTIAKDFLQKEEIVHPLPRLSKNSPKKQSKIILFSSRLYYFLENKKKMKKKSTLLLFLRMTGFAK